MLKSGLNYNNLQQSKCVSKMYGKRVETQRQIRNHQFRIANLIILETFHKLKYKSVFKWSSSIRRKWSVFNAIAFKNTLSDKHKVRLFAAQRDSLAKAHVHTVHNRMLSPDNWLPLPRLWSNPQYLYLVYFWHDKAFTLHVHKYSTHFSGIVILHYIAKRCI